MLNFGLTACRDSLPHMQQMAVGMGAAVDRYESIYLETNPASQKRSVKEQSD